MSFDEYLQLISEQPERQLRGSSKYLVDVMDHFGRTSIEHTNGLPTLPRFKVFDYSDEGNRKIIGQEHAQNQIYSVLRAFVRQGLNNKLILLHGPNGSAKSSIVQSLMSGMERYAQTSEGAVYSFNWIFPIEKITKGKMGLGESNYRETFATYAKLPEEEILARIPCDLRDHPILLLPQKMRKLVLERMTPASKFESVWASLPQYLVHGGLSHRNKLIFDALLASYNGDLKKVLMHVQVERFFFSRRYREGLVSIEPQMHVDANYQQLTMSKSMGSLPSSLQGLNLFQLTGDLPDANRGLLEFSDLLKRPVDTFKYLLIACESNSVSIGSSIAYLDSVFFGSTNELQLDAFKEFPDFNSFKARIELIRVPYLLEVSHEREIYKADIDSIQKEKPVAPHVAWTVAMWAILTRLKKPNSINYPPSVSALVSNLSPLEKAKLYDRGEMPMSLNPDERKTLRSHFKKLREEYTNIPYYEGRLGASAREMRSLLFSASQSVADLSGDENSKKSLTPLAILKELEEFVKRTSEYEFLKQDVKDGYHDAMEFINVVRNEYINLVDREVRECIGLYEPVQWEEFIRRYVGQISLALKKEKQKNPITGRMEDPDFTLISEFEKIVDAPADAVARESFRQNIITLVGAWSLDHPSEPVVYRSVFPDFWSRIERHYFESQKALLEKMNNALQIFEREGGRRDITDEGARLADSTLDNMIKRFGYTEDSAREVIMFLMRSRYR